MSAEQPFKISVSDADLELLRKKLEIARLPDELDDAGWDYGVPLADIKRLVAHWKNSFDWRKAEAKINELPQFTRDIDIEGHGKLNIHYVHAKSTEDNVIPLLYVHGWPGHFWEVNKLLPLLTAVSPDHPTFHVVAPSLPGYGFSEAPKKKGFAGPQYAETCHKLMISLGYTEYVTLGGDWGSMITKVMAYHYQGKGIKAWHTMAPSTGFPSPYYNPLLFLQAALAPWTAAERAGLERSKWFQKKGTGYFQEQCTQPQTIGYSLADSPVGLLAWVYEKLVTWTDSYPWTDDEVLDWISIYWFSRAGPAASTRIYYEVVRSREAGEPHMWSPIPHAQSYFPKELALPPKSWARAVGNVVLQIDHEGGGHFPAYEVPEVLVADVCKMFGKGGPAFGVVTGKSGYTR